MKHLTLFQNSKRGFALTEVLLAIAVIVIIGIAAYPLFKNSRTNSQVESMANTIAILQTNTEIAFRGQSNYKGLGGDGMTTLDGLGMLPDSVKTSTPGFYVDPWGGRIKLDYTISTSGNPVEPFYGFSIQIGGIPQDACNKLAIRLAPAFIGIGSTQSAGDIKGNTNATNPSTLNMSQLNAVCADSASNSGDGPSLYFTTS